MTETTRAVKRLVFTLPLVLCASIVFAQPAPRTTPVSDIELQILAIEDARAPADADVDLLVRIARGQEARAQSVPARRLALRALGRLERLELVSTLRSFLRDPALREIAATGLLLTLRSAQRGPTPSLAAAVVAEEVIDDPIPPRILGELPLGTAAQFSAVERRLAGMLAGGREASAMAASGLEALARRNRRLGTLSKATLTSLREAALRQADGAGSAEAFNALLAAGAMDASLVEAALRDRDAGVRRIGALALLGTPIEASRRTPLIRTALADRTALVRYDALRAWIRHEAPANGCAPILSALTDASLHIALAAIDALAEACPADDVATARLAQEFHRPPTSSAWHRPAHALVAAARRRPAEATAALPAFTASRIWQVRMYAARAAASLRDAGALTKLASDRDDNVREVAVPALRTVAPDAAAAATIAALGRDDYQLLRTVAIALKGAAPTPEMTAALAGALERVTAQRKETSRDARLALIERLGEQGGPSQRGVFEALLSDYDARVATTAAWTLMHVTGEKRHTEPKPLPRPAAPTAAELRAATVARVFLDSGRTFDIELDVQNAPLAAVRMLRLIRARYYDGLTFHRVVPNFVIQGGSPGANEYAGDALFMRDELSAATHAAGTVGISTRGRDTGDAQIFVNLADNRRLDFEYTIAGRIVRGSAAGVGEGTTIRRIRMVAPTGQ